MTVSLKFPMYANGQRIGTDYQFNVPPFPSGSLSFATAIRDKGFQENFRKSNPGVEIPASNAIWSSAGLWNINK